MLKQQSNTGNQEYKNFSWLGYMEPDNQKTFNKIDFICTQYSNFDTLNFIHKLKDNLDSRESFLNKNGLTELELENLFNDIFLPLPKNKLNNNRNDFKKATENILKIRTRSNQIEEIKELLELKSYNNALFIKLEGICIVYQITLAQCIQALKESKLDSNEINQFKTLINHSNITNLQTYIGNNFPILASNLNNYGLKNTLENL